MQRTAAVAAVGANSPLISMILNLFLGIALGANVVIANAIGQRDSENAQQAVHTAIVFSLLCGILVTIGGELLASPLLYLLRIPKEVFPLALVYLRIYLIGMPMILLYNFEASIFRSAGETNTPLFVLAASGILNVLLNLFFVIMLHMTVNGVAIATVLSNTVSAILLYHKLRHLNSYIQVNPKLLRLNLIMLKRILQIGLPAGIQSAVFCFANVIIQSAINSLGTIVMAASSAAYNIEIFAYNIFLAFGQACTTFVGQNFGAGNLQRCKRILGLSLLEGAIALWSATLLLLFFGKPILAIFNNDPEVIQLGYTRLIMVLCAYTFSLLYEVMSSYMRGFGISLLPAVLTTVSICGIRISWTKFVFPYHSTFETLMLVYPISLAVTAFLIFIVLLYCRPSKRFATIQK